MLSKALLEGLGRAVECFDKLGINYVLIGGLAASIWGRLRSTRDFDVLAVLSAEDLAAVREELRQRGFAHMDRSDRHFLDEVTLYRFWYPVEGTDFSLPLDLQVGKSDFHQSVLARAVMRELVGVSLRIASCEDLILLKAAAWRPIDRADAIELASLCPVPLDLDYMQLWAVQLGVTDRLCEVLQTLE